MAVTKGTGTTAALTTSTYTANLINAGEIREAVEDIDITHLGIAATSNAQSVSGDNPKLQAIPLVTQAKHTEATVRAGTSDTLTITYPKLVSGSASAKSIVLTGFVMENTIGANAARNEVQQDTLSFMPDGITVTINTEA